MIVIKDRKMPSCCVAYNSDNDYYIGCPFYKICEQRETIKVNFKPIDCPLVEIVTCEKCEHWDKDSTPRIPDDKEYHFCPIMDCNTSEDFYCADGERRE